MNRLGIFVFYDAEGRVDNYVDYLLRQISDYLERLIIIVNGIVNDNGLRILENHTDLIIQRENIGLDGGAYKDFFCQYTGEYNIDIQEFDEIILMNDTFFGPLYSLNTVLNTIESTNVDFWGISRHPGGFFGEIPFPEHIQAYFLAISKSMFLSDAFVAFWKEMSYPNNHFEAVNQFEIRFTKYFSDYGYTYTTWLDQAGYIPEQYENVCCSSNMMKLISLYQMPILKKKILYWTNYEKIMNVYNYIESNTDFPIRCLYENLYRQYALGNTGGLYNFFGLNSFYESHKRVYIYGAGKRGMEMLHYFGRNKWKVDGIIVTTKNGMMPGVIELHDLTFKPGDGIVLAMNLKKSRTEVVDLLEGKVDYFIGDFEG